MSEYNLYHRAITLLDEAELKKTPGRIAILTLLLKEQRPLSQQEISQSLEHPLNEVSIYRALRAFEKAAIVHKVEGGDKTWRFAITEQDKSQCKDHYHPHFICTSCGKVECFTEIEIPKIKPPNSQYTITNREMVLKGSCDECAN
ncbi:Fur family transcriptional regulator [Natranaerobius thermophilus]|uniref:Ferric uptake regulator, Fur family n=1 Tax=Natranaerobius thermophilus (strain ATCC BAA-1301 / DSM 18059 / JW/NM-WN-LF) TaxID=457570 RepID=B2A6G8_NATTJ|nr:transcriptional repressor [Natranaerobius thermophilus]ACB85501.1 ferric uptake regulator, Fur family [Natranaerobius thermophilus JW/NM-WN-LF]